MTEEVTRLIYDYQKNRKPIDVNFIEKLVDIGVASLDLNGYIDKFIIDTTYLYPDPDKFDIGGFYLYNKKLKIYLQELINFIILEREAHFSSGDSYDLIPFTITAFMLLHEFRHIEQSKTLYLGATDFRSEVILLSHPGYLLIDKKIFSFIRYVYKMLKSQKNYIYCPFEKDADYFASTNIFDILILLEQSCNKLDALKDYYEYFSLNKLLGGYDKTNNPAERYFINMGLKKPWRELMKEAPSFTLEEKLSLGLELSEEELQFLNNRCQTLERRLY